MSHGEEAANDGRMFAITPGQLSKLRDINNYRALANLLISNLFKLSSRPKVRNKLLEKLKYPTFRKNLIKGFKRCNSCKLISIFEMPEEDKEEFEHFIGYAVLDLEYNFIC